MNIADFRQHAHALVDWMADYMENVGQYPVHPNIRPGDIKKHLPEKGPEKATSFKAIFNDFERIVLPGITHWQHPQFFAYFPSGFSPPSTLAEMLSSALGLQCMTWFTSPAAEELEERMMEWLRDMLGLPAAWQGVIQDSSSTANLVAILTARESSASYSINQQGFGKGEKYRIYASVHCHSSIDKAVKIAGLGWENLVRIEANENFEMIPEKFEEAIEQDIAMGLVPLCVISTMGTTDCTSIDPIETIGKIAKKYTCWHHVDASYAGTALLLPDMRWMSKGLEHVDSFVVNPHKWMLTHFDCSAYFVSDRQALIKTLSVSPPYLKTPVDKEVNNYRDWSIPLGRRFRALKLWFVICSYGVDGLRRMIQKHIRIGRHLKDKVEEAHDFELLAPAPLNLVCFRYRPQGLRDEEALNALNDRLIASLNGSGELFLSSAQLNGKVALRFVSGNYHTRLDEVEKGWHTLRKHAYKMAPPQA